MNIKLDDLDKLVHALNEDLGGSDSAYMVSLDSTGYTYGISLNGFSLFNPEWDTLSEDVDEVYQIELICRNNLIDFCNFWAEARLRIYAPTHSKQPSNTPA